MKIICKNLIDCISIPREQNLGIFSLLLAKFITNEEEGIKGTVYSLSKHK